MNLGHIIGEAKRLANSFVAKGHDSVRLPVIAFEDWLEIYEQTGDGPSLAEYRSQTKRNYYLMHYLRGMGVEVLPVPVRAPEFGVWARASGHNLADPHERAHAVGEYVNDIGVEPARCAHKSPLASLGGENVLATITVYGDTPDDPEVMTVVTHLRDGKVLDSREILAADHSPQQAWEVVETFLDERVPGRVYHDKVIRRPEYCPDCNSLQFSVASPDEMDRVRA